MEGLPVVVNGPTDIADSSTKPNLAPESILKRSSSSVHSVGLQRRLSDVFNKMTRKARKTSLALNFKVVGPKIKIMISVFQVRGY